MDEHGGGIALLPPQIAMRDGGLRHGGIAVLSRQLGLAQTNDQIVNQLGKMPGAFLIAEMEVVEFRSAFRSSQPICDQSDLAAFQYCGHAFRARRLGVIIR